MEAGNPRTPFSPGNQALIVPSKLTPYFTEADLESIALAVNRAEIKTIGEIRVHINAQLLPFENPRKRAIRIFRRIGMQRTRRRSGVLLFLTLKEHRFEIVADVGINSRVEQATWDTIAEQMSKTIAEKGLTQGIVNAVDQIGEILRRHFPAGPDDRNELANQVSF